MHRIVSDEALDTLFRNVRRDPAWLDRRVGDTLLRAVWGLVKLGPISDKSAPARILFLRSDEAKERLAPALPPDERAGARVTPVMAILASELGAAAADGSFAGEEARPRALAARDGALRGAYLILAARSLGLDCRPIWDFHAAAVETAFFPDGTVVATFLCGLGYGDAAQIEPIEPRPGCDETCRIL
jgi:3-hydroxypropanoate dehydrogenase